MALTKNYLRKIAKECIKQMHSWGLKEFLAQGDWATWNGCVVRSNKTLKYFKYKEDPSIRGIKLKFQGKAWELEVSDYIYLRQLSEKLDKTELTYWVNDNGEKYIDSVRVGDSEVLLLVNNDVEVCKGVLDPEWKYFKSGFVIPNGGSDAFNEEVENLKMISRLSRSLIRVPKLIRLN